MSSHALDAQTVMPSVTLPCHMSLFHSVDPGRHGITTNTYLPQVRPVTGLVDQLDAFGKKCAFFYTWEELRDLSRPDHLHTALCINQHKQKDTDIKITDAAIRYIREHAAQLNVLPDRIFITGFSAGGHLSASAGTMYHHHAVKAAFLAQYGDENTALGRPDGMILCYPVITSGNYAHRGSFAMLCGNPGASEDAMREFSTELWVDDQTPPAFLWHTSDDNGVPVQNSLLFADALSTHHIPFECHIFPPGAHGLSLCDKRTWVGNPGLLCPTASPWIEHAIRWANEL
jgi:predicted esterase